MKHPYKFHVWRKHRHAFATGVLLILIASVMISITAVGNIDRSSLYLGIGASFLRMLAAYTVSLLIAIPASLLVTKSRKAEAFLMPVFDILQSMPGLALLPLAVLWLGKGNIAAIFLLVTAMVWSILFSTVASLKSVREDLADAALIFGAQGWKRFLYFTLPAVFPAVMTGTIVAWGAAWEVIVGAELAGISLGIGTFLNTAADASNTRLLVIALVVLSAFIFLLNKFVWLPLLRESTQYQTE
ncbi:ABC transporter permease subunit [Candidatus Woesearchaeota archaeon]|nr:ABC transporter permease subunit [Candidatus Woesearchaeota archaeon]